MHKQCASFQVRFMCQANERFQRRCKWRTLRSVRRRRVIKVDDYFAGAKAFPFATSNRLNAFGKYVECFTVLHLPSPPGGWWSNRRKLLKNVTNIHPPCPFAVGDVGRLLRGFFRFFALPTPGGGIWKRYGSGTNCAETKARIVQFSRSLGHEIR